MKKRWVVGAFVVGFAAFFAACDDGAPIVEGLDLYEIGEETDLSSESYGPGNSSGSGQIPESISDIVFAVPPASFCFVNVDTIFAGDSATWYYESRSGKEETFSWVFPEGPDSTSAEKSPTITYPYGGQYSGKVIVKFKDGSKDVEIECANVANVIGDPAPGVSSSSADSTVSSSSEEVAGSSSSEEQEGSSDSEGESSESSEGLTTSSSSEETLGSSSSEETAASSSSSEEVLSSSQEITSSDAVSSSSEKPAESSSSEKPTESSSSEKPVESSSSEKPVESSSSEVVAPSSSSEKPVESSSSKEPEVSSSSEKPQESSSSEKPVESSSSEKPVESSSSEEVAPSSSSEKPVESSSSEEQQEESSSSEEQSSSSEEVSSSSEDVSSSSGEEESIENAQDGTVLTGGKTYEIQKCRGYTSAAFQITAVGFKNCLANISTNTPNYWSNTATECRGEVSSSFPLTMTVPEGATVTITSCH